MDGLSYASVASMRLWCIEEYMNSEWVMNVGVMYSKLSW
jgi:hypothetical protein